jgi:arginine decarboxylase-like protein
LSDEDRRAYDRYEENTHYEASMHESHYGRGKLEGKAEGKAETLIQIIKRKFNKVLSKEDEVYVIAKIQQANLEQLTGWIDGVFDSVTLDDLFKLLERKS